jgi:murein DD-endopeptidase MepM/ murein hydrolase activator NlpD
VTVRRAGRVTSRAVIACVLLVVVAPAIAGASVATGEPPTSTTVPTPATTTAPSEPTPPPATTPPATPPAPTATTPSDANGEPNALSPEQTLATETEAAALTDGQRALLRQLQAAKDTLATRQFALVALAREVTAARDRRNAARAVEAQARARVEETAAQIRSLKDEIVRLAAAAYRNHTAGGALGAIGSLSATNAITLSRAQVYVRADASLLSARVDTLTVLENRLKSEQRVAESARAEAESSAADLDARLATQTQAFDEARDATAKAQTAVARSLGSGGSLLAQIIAPRFGADSITTTLAVAQAGQADPASLDGIFAMPVGGARLASHFGIRIHPIEGTIGFHAGVDFAADARTPIHAAAPGVVVIAGECGGYGNCVVIEHGASLATLYAHQSVLMSRVGDIVTAGEVIGLVGSTGISTGPHLHFEVRLHGAPIDPVPTLAG